MNLISKNFFLNSIISIQDTFNTASCYVLHKPIRRTQFRQIGLQSIIFLTVITLKSTAQNESCLYISIRNPKNAIRNHKQETTFKDSSYLSERHSIVCQETSSS